MSDGRAGVQFSFQVLLIIFVPEQQRVYAAGWQKEEDGKTLVCDKRDRAITCVFCLDHHLTLCFLVLLLTYLFKQW